MDSHRVAFDGVWAWAEMRGVRADFWRDGNMDWNAMITLCDTEGDFSESVVIPLITPSKAERRRRTMEELRAEYTKTLRAALDAATAKARAKRRQWQLGRLA